MAKVEEEQIEEEIVEKKPKAKPKAKPKPKKSGEFTIKKENPKILKGIIEALEGIIDECNFIITKEAFIVEMMDPSRVCMIRLVLKSGDFDEYKITEEATIGLNLNDFEKVLKRSSPKDSVELSYKEKEQRLKIKMKREGRERPRTFTLSTIDVDVEDLSMESLNGISYRSIWKMDPPSMVEALKDAEIYSDVLNIKTVANDGLILSSIGELGEMTYELETEELIEADLEETNTGAYAITFLKSLLKLASITEELEISLLTDHPLKMVFNLLEGEDLNSFLASRVEEADFDDTDLEEL